MFNSSYFYNKTVKKTVAVFGTLFNDISVAKNINGTMQGITRVPISYGPRQKFLARLTQFDNENPDVAIRIPRMSFEISSIAPDSTTKLNRLNTSLYPIENNSIEKRKVYQSIPYIIGMQLHILARHQDDALQILEQIVPYFNPEYTLTVKDMEGPGSLTDLPISLQGVSMQDDYEGDFQGSRRLIIYTLDFNIKVKFAGPFSSRAKIIKSVDAYLYDDTRALAPVDRVRVELGDPENDTPDEYTVITSFGFDDLEDLPPLSQTLQGLSWQVERNIGNHITYNITNGRTIQFQAGLDSPETSELILISRYYNSVSSAGSGDPDAILGASDQVKISCSYIDSPAFNRDPGYLSTGLGSYVKMYFGTNLLLSSEDGNNKTPTLGTPIITVGRNQDVILRYTILMSPGASLNITPVLSYVP
jgi:hypothetical protein